MHPYRSAPGPADDSGGGVPGEEWALATLLALLGVTRVAIALVRGERLGDEATIAGILGAVGVTLLVQLVARTVRGAGARTRTSTSSARDR